MTTTDKLGCGLHKLADAIEMLDEKFADEHGNISIDTIDDFIKLSALGLHTVENIYTDCLNKEFKVNVKGPGGVLINTLLTLLLELDKNTNAKP